MQPAQVLNRSNIGSCSYCGSGSAQEIISGVQDWFFHNVEGQFALHRCAVCGSLWLADGLPEQELPKAYSTYYTHGSEAPAVQGRSGLKALLKQLYIANRFGNVRALQTWLGAMAYRVLARDLPAVDALYRFAPPAPLRILDYGCGDGEYLRRMAAFGNDVVGLEWDPVCVGNGRKAGLELHLATDPIPAGWACGFDFITLNHVLEHVQDPATILRQLKSWLKPDGLIHIEVPNATAEGLGAFGRYWRGLEAPRHLSLPSRIGLERLLNGVGLQLREQVLRQGIRKWLWQESLAAVPETDRVSYAAGMYGRGLQGHDNIEFLTLLVEHSD